MVKLKLVTIAAGVALWSTGVLASPITYTESATVSGTLGASGASFSNVITITGTGDTTGVFTDNLGILRNPLPSASFSISGGGSGTFTDAIEVFDNLALAQGAGFDDASLSGVSILDTFNSAFLTYNLAKAIGPITGSSFFNNNAFATTAGPLVIRTSGNSTFTATTTPLPAALPLFATGLGALGLLGWRRKRKAQAVA